MSTMGPAMSMLLAAASLLAPAVAFADVGPRPVDLSVGLGPGWNLPADVDSPNSASVRLRLPTGLTVEPRFELSYASESTDTAVGDTTDTTFVFGVSAELRWPLMSRGPVDLIVSGGPGFQYKKDDPEGDDNATTTLSFALLYGIGVEYWFGPHWALSVTGYNPIFVRSSSTTDQPIGDASKTATTLVGLIYDPDVAVFVHLFF